MVSVMELEITSRPVETRLFERGSFELFSIAGRTVGIAHYRVGWHWAEHVGPSTGEHLCRVEHLGYVLRGAAAVLMGDGTEAVIRAGDFFAIPPGHDSWVVGDEPYVSLHLLGAEDYGANRDAD